VILLNKYTKMKTIKWGVAIGTLGLLLTFGACSSFNKTQKGAAVGTVTGAAMGAVIGKASGNTGMGAIIGAAAGGTAGAIIGRQMDKQAEEIKKTIPEAQIIRVEEGIVVEFSSKVLFGFDRSDLSNNAKSNLDKLVTILNEYKDTNIEIQGHTDSRGTAAYNQNLSEKRSQTVANYLVNRGVAVSRLSVIGFGESLPKYLNNTEEGRDNNRRVEFLISANDKMIKDAENEAGV
jgi:outer membrane protein OmpA-like peptidoglycan-associated protein